MRKMELTDASFLMMESRQTPMHVGGINLFTLPEGAEEQPFLNRLTEVLHNADEMRKPFGEVVSGGRIRDLGAYSWKKDDKLDLDYHIRHSALPQPGSYRELFKLVSRLHGQLLDRSRPLWEAHLIEGLQDRQFALYLKMHHAAIDGMGAMHLAQAMCSTRKNEKAKDSPMSLVAYERYKAQKYGGVNKQIVPREKELRALAEVLKEQFGSTKNILGALRRMSGAFFGLGGDLAVPWHNVPRSSLNAEISGARRFVAQSWDLERVHAVCKALDGTLNDIVLAMTAGALRRYLLDDNELPKQSLKAMTPVSLREKGDLTPGNAVGLITADLATQINDPEKRFLAIQSSMRAGKELLRSLSPREVQLLTQLTQAPALLSSSLGLAAQMPAFSTVISNVPGPKKQLYWNGARMDGIYPASALFDGFAINFTLVSYNGSLDFGIVACRRSIPQVQRMIDYLEASLVELEEVTGLAKP